jgi:hypothetical protein
MRVGETKGQAIFSCTCGPTNTTSGFLGTRPNGGNTLTSLWFLHLHFLFRTPTKSETAPPPDKHKLLELSIFLWMP